MGVRGEGGGEGECEGGERLVCVEGPQVKSTTRRCHFVFFTSAPKASISRRPSDAVTSLRRILSHPSHCLLLSIFSHWRSLLNTPAMVLARLGHPPSPPHDIFTPPGTASTVEANCTSTFCLLPQRVPTGIHPRCFDGIALLLRDTVTT